MPSVTIVAIPSEDDYTWKLSSQKVPHMTILFLGENPQNFTRIVGFLEHTVKTSLCRFGAAVDYRGELGDKKADVLFFEKDSLRKVQQFRSYLLGDDDIRRAFDSAAQFDEWNPHLTLGYPDSPAHEDTRDYPGLNWVNFDRVALWTGDFEGPTFRLDDQYPYYDDMSMSDLGANAASDILEHFGVKGMRWGVRRSESHGGSSHGPSDDHVNASAARAKAKKGGVKSLTNKELQDMITRMNLEQQYVRLAPPSKGAIILKKGGQVVGEILLGVGKSQVTKVLNDQASKLIAGAIKG